MAKLSPKHRPKIQKTAEYKTEGRFRWDLGSIAFEQKEKGKYSKKEEKDNQLGRS